MKSRTLSPLEAYRASHQRFKRVAYGELKDPGTGQAVIVSTVLIASGDSAVDGHFADYETRVFGGAFDQRSWREGHLSGAKVRQERAVSLALRHEPEPAPPTGS